MKKQEIVEKFDEIYKELKMISVNRDDSIPMRVATLKDGVSDTVKIFNWIAPIRVGDTTVITALPNSGKTYLLNEVIKSYEDFDNVAIYAVGEGFRRMDRVKLNSMNGVEIFIDSEPDGSDQDSIDTLNMLIDYLKDSINNGDKILLAIDSLTALINDISGAIPTSANAGAGGYTSESFKLLRKIFSLAGDYSNGASITIFATALAVDKSAGKLFNVIDSIAGAIIPLKKADVDFDKLNGSPSFDFKGVFSYREESQDIAKRWVSLATDYKSRPSEFICSKIKERM